MIGGYSIVCGILLVLTYAWSGVSLAVRRGYYWTYTYLVTWLLIRTKTRISDANSSDLVSLCGLIH